MFEILTDIMYSLDILAIIAVVLIIIARWGKFRKKFRTDEGVFDPYRAILAIFNVLGFTIGLIITITGALAIQGFIGFKDTTFEGLSVLALGLAIMMSGRDEIRSLSADRDVQRILEQLEDIQRRLPRQK